MAMPPLLTFGALKRQFGMDGAYLCEEYMMEIEELDKRIERLQSMRALFLIFGIILGTMWLIFTIITITKNKNPAANGQTFTFFMTVLSACMFIIGSTLAQSKIELYRVMRDIYREMLEKKSSRTTNTPEA